jgi:REP element-mobilizing transposase RayT
VELLRYHLVKSTYGMWLPGDERGSWSARWDTDIGFIEPHMLHPGDPYRLRMSQERMLHPPVVLDHLMSAAIERAIGRCALQSNWKVAAGTIEPTHIHLLLTTGSSDIDRTCKWLSQQMTRAVHEETPHQGPVWAEGKWCSAIWVDEGWVNTWHYIESHNVRKGLGREPFKNVPGWYRKGEGSCTAR